MQSHANPVCGAITSIHVCVVTAMQRRQNGCLPRSAAHYQIHTVATFLLSLQYHTIKQP